MNHIFSDVGWVYFVRAEATDFVKIGHTKVSVYSRVQSLQVGCPLELTLEARAEGSVKTERWIHTEAAEYHERGEWFRLTPELVKHLADRVGQIESEMST